MNLQKLVPSGLSILRIILAVILFYSFLSELRIFSIIIFIFAILTDFLDGYFARRLKVTSNYGAFLDTIADFVLIITIFSAFTIVKLYPYWILILITIMFLQFILTSGMKKPIYDPLGKYYGAFLFICVFITLISSLSYIINILLILIVLFTFISIFTRFYSLYGKINFL